MSSRPTLMVAGKRLLAAAALVVSLVFIDAPLRAQEPSAAKVLVEMGQVSILKDGNQLALWAGQDVKPRQTIVTGPDSYAKFQLADGSTFEVFEKSTVTFRDNFPAWTDVLNLLIGRVKVFIDHTKGPNPNSVTTPTAVISVRGTVFDVVVEDSDGTTFVTVDEGLVQVRNTTAPGGEPLLRPGDSIRVFPHQPLIPASLDHAAILRGVLKAAEQAVYQIAYGRQSGGGIGGAGGVTGAQGDKGKGTGTTTTTGAPAPPTAPTAPAPPAAPSTGH